VNVGSAEARPLGTGLPAVEVVSAWQRGRSIGSAGEPRARSGDEPGHREGPQLTVEAVGQMNIISWRRMDALAAPLNIPSVMIYSALWKPSGTSSVAQSSL
jgi:hypothetical protein